LIFIICLKQIFLSTTQFGGHKKDLGVTAPECPTASAGLGRTIARKSSIGGLHVCAGGLDILKNFFNSQHEQHLQIVQITYNYFPANTHNRHVVSCQNFLKQLNKRNWVVNHCHLIDGDYLEMS